METISDLFNERLAKIKESKDRGDVIIGYIPNGFMPEELLNASGMKNIALFKGGESSPVVATNGSLGRFLDPFSRAQLGYRITGVEPLYQLPDFLIVPITDIHTRGIADAWSFYTDTEVIRLPVPHQKTDRGFEYYLEELVFLKQAIERFAGKAITDDELKAGIRTANRIRGLFNKVSLLRRSAPPMISGKDFIALNHMSYFMDDDSLINTLEELIEKAQEKKGSTAKAPRILLTGPTLALNDTKVIDLIEETGASVVIEDFTEGVRDYHYEIDLGGDPLHALAEGYFFKRNPGAYFRGSTKERFSRLMSLIDDFMVDGVVWYSLLYRETYDIEAFLFHRVLSKRQIPMFRITSAYDENEAKNLYTRIETFIETLSRSSIDE